jgi:hypothetical protein
MAWLDANDYWLVELVARDRIDEASACASRVEEPAEKDGDGAVIRRMRSMGQCVYA